MSIVILLDSLLQVVPKSFGTDGEYEGWEYVKDLVTIFFDKMIKLCHQGESFELQLRFDTPSLSVYLKTSRTLIHNCLNLDSFTLNPCDDVDDCRPDFVSFLPLILSPKDNIIDISEKLTQTGKELRLAIFEIRKIGRGYHIKTYLVANYGERLQMFSAIGGGTHLLDLDLRAHLAT